jgi:hypothetical protein
MGRMTFRQDGEAFTNYLTKAVVEKLADYEDKEEQGLLIELPCKVGDTVHICLVTDIKNHDLIYGIFEAKVTRFILDSSCLCFEMVTTDENKLRYEFTVEAFGKTVFRTRSEAEEALAKMGGK